MRLQETWVPGGIHRSVSVRWWGPHPLSGPQFPHLQPFLSQTCSSWSFPSQEQAALFFLPAWGPRYMSLSLTTPPPPPPHTHTPNAVSNLCKPTCSSHSGLGPGGVQTLLSGRFVSSLTPAVCAPLRRQRDPLKPDSGHIPPLRKPRTSPSYLESGHPFSQWSYLPHLTFTLSIKPASQPFLGLTQPLFIKVFATAVPTAWNSPPTHTPSPTTKRLPLPLLASPYKYHLSETPSLTTLSDRDTPPAGSVTFSCFIFLLGTCSLSFLHSLSV